MSGDRHFDARPRPSAGNEGTSQVAGHRQRDTQSDGTAGSGAASRQGAWAPRSTGRHVPRRRGLAVGVNVDGDCGRIPDKCPEATEGGGQLALTRAHRGRYSHPSPEGPRISTRKPGGQPPSLPSRDQGSAMGQLVRQLRRDPFPGSDDGLPVRPVTRSDPSVPPGSLVSSPSPRGGCSGAPLGRRWCAGDPRGRRRCPDVPRDRRLQRGSPAGTVYAPPAIPRIENPPSVWTTSPVTPDARSLASQTAVPPMSSRARFRRSGATSRNCA